MSNQGKNTKDPNATRQPKIAEAVVNDNSEVAKLAKEQAKKAHKERAEAVGLEETASIEEIIHAENKVLEEKAAAEAKKNEKLKETNHKLWLLKNHIETVFADRAKTNAPGVTETELHKSCGHLGASANIVVKYTNDEKTLGYVEVEEFDLTIRIPEKGEFAFGIDYAAINAELKAKNAK